MGIFSDISVIIANHATPSVLALKSTNGPSRRPEKDNLRKVLGNKARVHGRRNPGKSDLNSRTYEHKRGGAEDKIGQKQRQDELERREDLLRRKIEVKYIKDRIEREAEVDHIQLLEERLKRDWELKPEREKNERIVEEDRAGIITREGMPGGTRSFHFSKGGGGPNGFNFSSADDIFSEFMRTGGVGTRGEAAQRAGVPLETSSGPRETLQYQAYLNDYRPSRDVRSTLVTQRSSSPGDDYPYPPKGPNDEYHDPPVDDYPYSTYALKHPLPFKPSYRPPPGSFQAPPYPPYPPLKTQEYGSQPSLPAHTLSPPERKAQKDFGEQRNYRVDALTLSDQPTPVGAPEGIDPETLMQMFGGMGSSHPAPEAMRNGQMQPQRRPYAAELGSFELPPPPVHRFPDSKITPLSAVAGTRSQPLPCKYFAKGNCKAGSKCAFAHISPDGHVVNRHTPGGGGHFEDQFSGGAQSPAGLTVPNGFHTIPYYGHSNPFDPNSPNPFAHGPPRGDQGSYFGQYPQHMGMHSWEPPESSPYNSAASPSPPEISLSHLEDRERHTSFESLRRYGNPQGTKGNLSDNFERRFFSAPDEQAQTGAQAQRGTTSVQKLGDKGKGNVKFPITYTISEDGTKGSAMHCRAQFMALQGRCDSSALSGFTHGTRTPGKFTKKRLEQHLKIP
jgi:hypothetical protein